VAAPKFLTPEMRVLRARIGGYTAVAKYGGHALTEAARAANPSSLSYWERRVDPENRLPAVDRASRAAAAQKAHFSRLAFKSARARARTQS